jgi:nucleotide-binding universal stress UspA family protein
MFQRILVAVDGSINSDKAVEIAADIARIRGSSLNICHAFHIPEQYKTDLVDELEEALMADARRILSHASAVAEKSGVESQSKLLKKGHPAEAVVAYAAELEVDLIVAGVRGRTSDQARAMGSVSSSIAEQASCSVLLVRPHR